MKAYLVDEEQFADLKALEKWLYADNALKPGFLDKKRDMANALNYLLYQIERSQYISSE